MPYFVLCLSLFPLALPQGPGSVTDAHYGGPPTPIVTVADAHHHAPHVDTYSPPPIPHGDGYSAPVSGSRIEAQFCHQ